MAQIEAFFPVSNAATLYPEATAPGIAQVVTTVTGATMRCMRQVACLLLEGEARAAALTRITHAFDHNAAAFPVAADQLAAQTMLTACEGKALAAAQVIAQATRERVAFVIAHAPQRPRSLLRRWHDTLRFVPFTSGIAAAATPAQAATAFSAFVTAAGTFDMLKCPVCATLRPPTEMVKAACGHYVCIATTDGVNSCLSDLLGNAPAGAVATCPMCHMPWTDDEQGKPSTALRTVVTCTSDLSVTAGLDEGRLRAAVNGHVAQMRGHYIDDNKTYGGALVVQERGDMLRRSLLVADALRRAYTLPPGPPTLPIVQRTRALHADIDKVKTDLVATLTAVAAAAGRVQAMAEGRAPLADPAPDMRIVEQGIAFLAGGAVVALRALQDSFDSTIGALAPAAAAAP